MELRMIENGCNTAEKAEAVFEQRYDICLLYTSNPVVYQAYGDGEVRFVGGKTLDTSCLLYTSRCV